MKRPIKFRGYDTADGVRDWVTFTLDELLSGIDHYELVDPDTIVQLVGYDKDGNEVYEGDEVAYLSPDRIIKAEMTDIYVCSEAFRLKEAKS